MEGGVRQKEKLSDRDGELQGQGDREGAQGEEEGAEDLNLG